MGPERAATSRSGEPVDTPLGRVATVDDVADTVLALASDLTRATTGGFIAVDGGSTMP